MSNLTLSFGDNVRVRVTVVTEAAGLAGLPGQVHGFTTPSVTGITALGDVKDDRAFNVFFKAHDKDFWLAPELLEFVDHGVGTTMQVGKGPKMVRTADGKWEPAVDQATPGQAAVTVTDQSPAQAGASPVSSAPKKKAWWKFWE